MSAHARAYARTAPVRLHGDQLMQLMLKSATVAVWIHTAVGVVHGI